MTASDDRPPRGRGCHPYATFAPGLFPAAAPYIVAQHADNSYVTGAAPAKPGEVIILWGTGFGPANPAVPAGQVFRAPIGSRTL